MAHRDSKDRMVGDCGHYLREIGPFVYRCDECEVVAHDKQIRSLRDALEAVRGEIVLTGQLAEIVDEALGT